MKNLKISLTAIVVAILLTISTGVYAHGSQVDTANAITMPSALNNGQGNVTTSISGDMKYQFVEISQTKYESIKRYEAIYSLINAYIKQDDNYETLLANYQKTYNETANGIMDKYGIQFNEEGLNAIKGLWITELTTYNESSWISANGTTISIDLTTFTGTKYFIAWVKIGDTYDAETYIVTGTGSKKDDNKNDNTIKNDNTTKKENITTTPSTTDKKDTTASSSGKTLPKTGISSTVLGLIAVAGASAGISYKKYRKIK